MKKIFAVLIIMGLVISSSASPLFARDHRVNHNRVKSRPSKHHYVSRHPARHNNVKYHHVTHYVRHSPVRYHHVTRYDHWGSFGVGLLTGSIVTNLLYALPQRQVVVYDSPAVVQYSEPVIIQRPTRVIEIPDTQTGEVVVRAALLNVRSGPGKNYPVTHQVRQGSRLVIKGSSTGWFYVMLPSGEYGWVMQEFTARVQAPANG